MRCKKSKTAPYPLLTILSLINFYSRFKKNNKFKLLLNSINIGRPLVSTTMLLNECFLTATEKKYTLS